MDPGTERVVLLYYRDFERDTFVRGDRHLKRYLKPVLDRFRTTQKVSGFYMWYQRLVRALRLHGYDVRLNDYRFARQHPDHPVGIVGYPHILEGWSLPNPAVLGPCLFDHPAQAPDLMKDHRFGRYLVTCDWMYDVFAPVYGQASLGRWFAGIETDEWQEGAADAKDIDVLVYDKTRFDVDRMASTLVQPALAHLARCGMRVEVVRYGLYDHASFQELLKRSRSMLFLCEHETQGMAYQEAMAANVPILAWDQGWWLDPARERFTSEAIAATSVPYFSERCGRRFRSIDELPAAFDDFWAHLSTYEPRRYVATELSFEASARAYMLHYGALASDGVGR